MKAICPICPHHCALDEGKIGRCRARKAENGKVVPINYGIVASLALDPIEKKPLYRFFPGSFILSVGSYGCNMNCPFCQNFGISMAGQEASGESMTPGQLASLADELRQQPRGNLGIAFTYNEPFIGYEFVRDTAALLRDIGLKAVAVTNGQICREPLMGILPLIHAMNIDLKGFSERYYQWAGGDFATTRQTIALAWEAGCHVEVTTLVVPGENDSEEEMDAEAAWLASLSPDIPLHISRFFPRHRVLDKPPTPLAAIDRLCRVARNHLRYVYPGNC